MEDDEILKELRVVRTAFAKKYDDDPARIVAALNAQSVADDKLVQLKLVERRTSLATAQPSPCPTV